MKVKGDRRLEKLDELVSLCARRGYIFPSSEIYGGINGFSLAHVVVEAEQVQTT